MTAAALRTWPLQGVPRNPDAWLLTVPRNRQRNAARYHRVRDGAAEEVALRMEEAAAGPADLPDERLGLLFACAHPAIDEGVRTPLMLQVVVGLDAARVAAAFVVPTATMAQRLMRAKARSRDAGLRFAVPEPEDRPARLLDVLDAVYAAFGSGWDDPGRGRRPEGARGRGGVPGPPPGPTAARGARGDGAPVAHAPLRGAPPRPARRRGPLRAARPPGPGSLVAVADHRGRGPARGRRPPPPLRPLPVRGGDPVRPCPASRDGAGQPRRSADALRPAGPPRAEPGRLGRARGRADGGRRSDRGPGRPRGAAVRARRHLPAVLGGAGARRPGALGGGARGPGGGHPAHERSRREGPPRTGPTRRAIIDGAGPVAGTPAGRAVASGGAGRRRGGGSATPAAGLTAPPADPR